MTTTTEVRWVRDPEGNTTEYSDLDLFYDALFFHGVTVPGREGVVTFDDDTTVAWGVAG